MLVGAGLMFVLMHGEVSAEGEKGHCELIDLGATLKHTLLFPKWSGIHTIHMR